MRILFTGASSFTGYWLVRQLTDAGHDVVATFTRKDAEAYGDDVRGRRVREIVEHCSPEFGCRFGDDRFVELIDRAGPFDVLSHHAADVTDYKSPGFDVQAALANNTRNIDAVCAAAAANGCSRFLLTGSVFEPGEGAGSDGLRAFSPYGLSKALTDQVIDYYAERHGLRRAKFVIPNPFGPLEEPRFTAYLVRTWRSGKPAGVNTPAYVRDNIHVSLLARAYVDFAERLHDSPGRSTLNPSGYAESQGAFARRFAAEMRPRLGLDCELDLADQTDFPEPRIRINTDPLDAAALGWDETAAWDAIATYYAAPTPTTL